MDYDDDDDDDDPDGDEDEDDDDEAENDPQPGQSGFTAATHPALCVRAQTPDVPCQLLKAAVMTAPQQGSPRRANDAEN